MTNKKWDNCEGRLLSSYNQFYIRKEPLPAVVFSYHQHSPDISWTFWKKKELSVFRIIFYFLKRVPCSQPKTNKRTFVVIRKFFANLRKALNWPNCNCGNNNKDTIQNNQSYSLEHQIHRKRATRKISEIWIFEERCIKWFKRFFGIFIKYTFDSFKRTFDYINICS